ncbi:transferase, partial [Trypanosoma cruzi]
MTPVDPKTMSPHYPESPQSLQSGSPEAEGLGRTEPQSLLPTFLAADFDVVDVSARLENEFFSAAQSAELNGSRSRHLQETIDRHENCSSAEKLLHRNGSCCRVDVTEEMTQVFQEPMTPLREASSLIEENRE